MNLNVSDSLYHLISCHACASHIDHISSDVSSQIFYVRAANTKAVLPLPREERLKFQKEEGNLWKEVYQPLIRQCLEG